MEDELNFFKMEGNLKKNENGRLHHFLENGRQPLFLSIGDYLSLSKGRLP